MDHDRLVNVIPLEAQLTIKLHLQQFVACTDMAAKVKLAASLSTNNSNYTTLLQAETISQGLAKSSASVATYDICRSFSELSLKALSARELNDYFLGLLITAAKIQATLTAKAKQELSNDCLL